MTNKNLRSTGTPETGHDDFKVIRGIGPGVEGRLYAAGIATYAQLAALTPEAIALLLNDVAGLSPERIIKQDWIGQAIELLPSASRATPFKPAHHQHYATFTVELLLNEQHEVRRTRVAHIQSSDEQIWAGWEAERLVQFIAHAADLDQPLPVQADEPIDYLRIEQEFSAEDREAVALVETTVADIEHTTEVTSVDRVSVAEHSSAEHHAASESAQDRPTTLLEIRELKLAIGDTLHTNTILRQNQPFAIWLSLNFDPSDPAQTHPYRYTAQVYAKKLGGRRQILIEQQGQVNSQHHDQLTFDGMVLAAGSYRLEATILLQPISAATLQPGPMAMIESGLIIVY